MKFALCFCLLLSYGSVCSIAQQSGALPNSTSSTATHSNNYAAKVAMLTSNRPHTYHETSLAENDKEDALKSSESSHRPASFSWMSGYSARPSSYEYTPTQESESSSSSSTAKYSPYMMPNSIANYYTGSAASNTPASLYQYFAQYPASIRDKLNSEESSPSRNITSANDEEKAQLKRLQTALLYHQIMALQEYQALNSRGGGGSSNGANMAALYSQLYQNQDPYGQYAGGNPSDDSQTSASESSSTSVPNLSAAELQQQLAQTIAYRQQLAQMAGQMGYGGGENPMSAYSGSPYEGGYGGGMGGGMSGALGGGMGGYGSSGYGMPSSMFGSSMMSQGGSGIGSLLGAGSMLGGGGLGSMLGSGLSPTGMGGMLGNLAGGLSSLASGGLMNSLGSIFG